jgi:hypothetical protein
MHYSHVFVTGALVFALVMTSGCTGLLMGDLKAEIHDSSSITIPLPLSSVLSVLVSQNNTTPPGNPSSNDEKEDSAFGNPLYGNSPFHVKSSTEETPGIDTDDGTPETGPLPPVVEQGIFLKAPPGELVIPCLGTASCNPVPGAKVTVTLIGIPNKTHIADCITQENGDFSFYVPPPMEKSEITPYTFNFEITAPGYILPEGSSNVVTDLANVSEGPFYTFNVCYQQPSEPNAMAVTRGGIAVIGRSTS